MTASASSNGSPVSGAGARPRADAWQKVTGAARYTGDLSAPGQLHAVLVTSSVPAGRIASLDTAEAERAPGVVAVLTHRNAPRIEEPGLTYAPGGYLPLQEDTVWYEGQPIAVVLAERLEEARQAAWLVRAEYSGTAGRDGRPVRTDIDSALAEAEPAPDVAWAPSRTLVGDVDAGLARADAVVHREYATALRHHSPIEPSATLAEWRPDGGLLVHDTVQNVLAVRDVLAAAFRLEPAKVRVVCRFTGGAFGCKGFVWPHQLIAPMAAKALGRPVRLVLSRADAFTAHGYQPPTRQTITLGATRDGRLTAVRHHSVNSCATHADYVELAASCSRTLYAAPAIETSHALARVHTVLPTAMRSPIDGPGLVALEGAVDELAYELGIDPLDLRVLNHADRHPTSGMPFSSKELLACYAEGARRFGWADRPMAPRSLRDGRDLVGWGVASCMMDSFRNPSDALVAVGPDGRVVVAAAVQEIGNGVRTVLPQLAAEALGADPDAVELEMGDTELPQAPGTYGSTTTLSVGSAVLDACARLRERLGELAGGDGPVTGIDGADAVLDGGKRLPLAALLAEAGEAAQAEGRLAVLGHWDPAHQDHAFHAFGAVFVEVRVDAELAIPRVSRVTGVYSAGRIVNPLTARSQMIGGISWGIGQALLEHTETDPRLGRFVSKNLAGYLLPVNADVPELDLSFVEERDPLAGPVGGRGIGELGSVGIGPAIANAVFHATGVRVRELPIAPEALLEAMRG
ncbi:xanthine dehydrogenase family protein molybdopterin-binding subunit [Phaeacidiphilus oryzae]|uniref:xanthine dehydrogenase family protein molybdopterin-binding subunit n=1 Tax=Phaeacidiphilus oryzae TaxID=348818 RepID=UPI0007C6D026|nr:xanthine dehydrogenase family protein molybdopterin-binding subunit [Phaeacidiphilus oryzae]